MVGLPREVDGPATFSTGGHSRQFRGGMFLGPVPETPQKLLEPMNTTAYWKDGKLEMPVNRARTR
jgi:hypothetical protein